MIALNLTATNTEQTILKDYLESNVNDILAEKINNGVRIFKDGKTLINKKDLSTFLKYACDEAQKQAEKGAKAACIDHKTVFGWVLHYFEENDITGTLFNEDGTEYKPPKPAVKNKLSAPTSGTTSVAAPKPKTEFSLFDLMSPQAASEPEPDESADEEDESEPDESDEEEDESEPDESADEEDESEPDESDEEEDESEPDESDEEFDESESVDDDEPEESETVITDNPRKPEQIIPGEWNDLEQLTALRRISETQYVDKDGIIYNSAEMTKATTPVITKSARPAASNNTVPDALIKLFGGAIIAR